MEPVNSWEVDDLRQLGTTKKSIEASSNCRDRRVPADDAMRENRN